MPNWIKGTMKLRGKREDVMRFLDNEIEPNSSDKACVERTVDDDFVEYTFFNNPHVKGTRRMFFDDQTIYMEDDDASVCIDVRQAWSFSPREGKEDLQLLEDFTKKYNIDIKLFGIESGFCFTQEVIVIRGCRAINNVKQYEDWFWDCPFPIMGG